VGGSPRRLLRKEERKVTVTEEISKTLRSLPRDSKGATLEPEADIANIRLAVEELRKAVIQLAEEIDRRDSAA
jgi:hypothetical protein